MCYGLKDGGKRCAGHTRPGYEQVMGDMLAGGESAFSARLDTGIQRVAEYASTRGGAPRVAEDIARLRAAFEATPTTTRAEEVTRQNILAACDVSLRKAEQLNDEVADSKGLLGRYQKVCRELSGLSQLRALRPRNDSEAERLADYTARMASLQGEKTFLQLKNGDAMDGFTSSEAAERALEGLQALRADLATSSPGDERGNVEEVDAQIGRLQQRMAEPVALTKPRERTAQEQLHNLGARISVNLHALRRHDASPDANTPEGAARRAELEERLADRRASREALRPLAQAEREAARPKPPAGPVDQVAEDYKDLARALHNTRHGILANERAASAGGPNGERYAEQARAGRVREQEVRAQRAAMRDAHPRLAPKQTPPPVQGPMMPEQGLTHLMNARGALARQARAASQSGQTDKAARLTQRLQNVESEIAVTKAQHGPSMAARKARNAPPPPRDQYLSARSRVEALEAQARSLGSRVGAGTPENRAAIRVQAELNEANDALRSVTRNHAQFASPKHPDNLYNEPDSQAAFTHHALRTRLSSNGLRRSGTRGRAGSQQIIDRTRREDETLKADIAQIEAANPTLFRTASNPA